MQFKAIKIKCYVPVVFSGDYKRAISSQKSMNKLDGASSGINVLPKSKIIFFHVLVLSCFCHINISCVSVKG